MWSSSSPAIVAYGTLQKQKAPTGSPVLIKDPKSKQGGALLSPVTHHLFYRMGVMGHRDVIPGAFPVRLSRALPPSRPVPCSGPTTPYLSREKSLVPQQQHSPLFVRLHTRVLVVLSLTPHLSLLYSLLLLS